MPASHIALGTGSSGLLQQLMHATVDPDDEVVYAWRSFESYPIVTHNPTGRALRRGDLERFLDRLPGDVVVVLDEAYLESNRGPTARTAWTSTGIGRTSWSCGPSPRPTVSPGCGSATANFVWLRLGRQTAALAEHCGDAGVTVRPYGSDGIRITIGERQANDGLLAAVARFDRRALTASLGAG